jgi:L-ascorbate metabolism protein UlaG (beta-lactamase superfamily)
VNLDGFKIYHTGDSDLIPEMNEIHTDVALLPVSGTYVMTVSEAIEATKVLQPKLVIPMHFGSIVGSKDMADEFKQKSTVRVEIPELE